MKPVGTYLLKDFERPEQLAQLVVEGLPADFPPIRATPAASPDDADGTRRRRRRLSWAAAAAAALLVVGAVAAILASRGGDPGTGGPTSNAVVSIDPASNRVDGRVAVGTTPTRIVVGSQSVWVLNAADGTLTKLDDRGRVIRTIGTDGTPTDVATTPGVVWVAVRPNRILRLDPTTGIATDSVTVKAPPSVFAGFMFLAPGAKGVWVAAQDRISFVDAATLRVRMLGLPTPDWGPVALTPGAIWVSTNDTLYRLDPRHGPRGGLGDLPAGPHRRRGRVDLGAEHGPERRRPDRHPDERARPHDRSRSGSVGDRIRRGLRVGGEPGRHGDPDRPGDRQAHRHRPCRRLAAGDRDRARSSLGERGLRPCPAGSAQRQWRP